MKLLRIMILSILIIAILTVSVYAFMNQKKFGKMPAGKRLERIKASPHYKNGSFQNLNPTPVMAEDASFFKIIKQYINSVNVKPKSPIPSVKYDLYAISRDKEIIVWLGHASYYIQTGGKRILVDPVLSGYASPVFFTTNAFDGTDPYKISDIPDIDYLIITHDHWDHLDYETVLALKPRTSFVICGLGVGEHLEYWGFSPDRIIEKDWYEDYSVDSSTTFRILPVRHFSGRGFSRNQSLWISVLIETHNKKIFLSGDTGYDEHFAEIGKKYGPIDFAILENGQYNRNWRYIHMLPEQTLQAAKDLKTKNVLPVHNSKFQLSVHSWWEPMKTLCSLATGTDITIHTPKIGEIWNINDSVFFSKWWESASDYKTNYSVTESD